MKGSILGSVFPYNYGKKKNYVFYCNSSIFKVFLLEFKNKLFSIFILR